MDLALPLFIAGPQADPNFFSFHFPWEINLYQLIESNDMTENPSVASQFQTRLFSYIQKIEPLLGRERAWGILEDLVKEGRLRWLNSAKIGGGNPVEEAYRLFYTEYLKLDPEDAEIVERTPRKIVVRWKNHCPTLDACRALDIDTRFVCRRVYESATQAFMEKIDPGLRFSRNYEAIRPNSEYCEETIELT
jgi:hypothetical protein